MLSTLLATWKNINSDSRNCQKEKESTSFKILQAEYCYKNWQLYSSILFLGNRGAIVSALLISDSLQWASISVTAQTKKQPHFWSPKKTCRDKSPRRQVSILPFSNVLRNYFFHSYYFFLLKYFWNCIINFKYKIILKYGQDLQPAF